MIRAATPEDAPAIARVHVAAWAETYAHVAPPEVLARRSVSDRAATWARILAADPADPRRAGVAVLALGGTVQGFASWGGQRDKDLHARGLTGEITALYLLRAVQGQGHGRALMVQARRDLLARDTRARASGSCATTFGRGPSTNDSAASPSARSPTPWPGCPSSRSPTPGPRWPARCRR